MHFPAILWQRQGMFLLNELDVLFMRLRVKTHHAWQLRQIVEEEGGTCNDHEDKEAAN